MGELQESWVHRGERLGEDGAGQPQGYVAFTQGGRNREQVVAARELVAITGDAYLNLLTFLGQHDIHREIEIMASSADPLPLLFADAERLTVKQGYTVLVRVVDVEAALKSRPVADPELTRSSRSGSATRARPGTTAPGASRSRAATRVVERSKDEGEMSWTRWCWRRFQRLRQAVERGGVRPAAGV